MSLIYLAISGMASRGRKKERAVSGFAFIKWKICCAHTHSTYIAHTHTPTRTLRCVPGSHLLRCALSVGSRRSIMRRFDAQIGPESTSCMTIRMASPSMDVCRLGASKSSKLGPVNEAMGAGMEAASPVGNAPRFCKAAMSGLQKSRERKVKKVLRSLLTRAAWPFEPARC